MNNKELLAFLVENQEEFEEKLLSEAVNVKEKINEIQMVGNIKLLNNAHQLVRYVIEEKEKKLIAFAEQEAIIWAAHSMTLAFKLEWVQAIRRTLWIFLAKYEVLHEKLTEKEDYYQLEKKVNTQFDRFFNYFFICYSKYKDELIESQRKLVENLSVPIIPVTPKTFVLPLIGPIDTFRANAIAEKVLTEIALKRIHNLIIDLSGVADLDADVIDYLYKVMDGISLMGSNVIITGLRPEVVKKMVQMGVSFNKKAVVRGTLDQALQDYISI